MTTEIRNTIQSDIDGLKEVLDSSELFPSEYLDEMISDYFNNPDTEEIWFTNISYGKIIGFGYCTPEKLTQGTYNLLAIAVKKEFQGKGEGRKMMDYIEHLLSAKGHRILIVETSSDSQYKLTRKFYDQLGYRKEATIRDFWKEGEDKVIYWKKLR
ncbi:GNAT family N-acetyltransferase [Flammeovirga sp. OC4]|uniref:GNAT family N-acetyltransferase n=1 Tax=Flammeovirga sp. OC4 TaxID=1382345 RepID=UPI0005C7A078|nr:N-acetyltransferase [Flammeovirga sp. OC4]